MKMLGIVRRIDELGRVVIPVELRRVLDINIKEPVEIFAENDKIIIKKYTPTCLFCSNADNVTDFKGKLVCAECLDLLKTTSNIAQ